MSPDSESFSKEELLPRINLIYKKADKRTILNSIHQLHYMQMQLILKHMSSPKTKSVL